MRRTFPFPAFAVLFGAALVYMTLPTVLAGPRVSTEPSKYLQIPGAQPVGQDTCMACHADVAKNYQHVFHSQQGVTCEDCHGNGSLHVAGGGDVKKILSLKKQPAAAANGICLSCHALDQDTSHWATGVHAANGVRCIDCHRIHSPSAKNASKAVTAEHGNSAYDTATQDIQKVNLVSPETDVLVQSRSVANEACLRCHQTEKAQLSMPYHHPLREGKMSCADCHDAHGGTTGRNLRVADGNELCLSCHTQYRGPFAYQHPPVSENCLNCHDVHGSPNTNLLRVSEPALCLQCHSGHHNGAGLPVIDRCTNCHSSIHGTDVATPSGGSRFIDKGSYGQPVAQVGNTDVVPANPGANSPARLRSSSHAVNAVAGAAAMLSSRVRPFPMAAAAMAEDRAQENADPGNAGSIDSISYRFLHLSGFASRVGEYDSLQQSAGTDVSTAYVNPQKHLTAVSRGVVISGSDYSVRSQVAIGDRLKALLDLRSLVQEQDHYPSYIAQLSSDFATPGAVTDTIPANAVFSVTRRLANGYVRFKLPQLPVHLFVKGDMQARTGLTQLMYLDENSTPAVYVGGVNTTCGQLCHQASQYQPVNATKRDISGGGDVELHRILRLTYEHTFSSFHDRLTFPTATYTGPFTPENEGYSTVNPPPYGAIPQDVSAGNYYLDIPSPNQFSADSLDMNLTPSAELVANGHIAYTRLRNTYTNNPQNWFDTDETVSWSPQERMRISADYHQQNTINAFTPYYSMYGNVSYHQHRAGAKVEYELPLGFSLEMLYSHAGITRSNAALWPQIYSFDNTDLQTVIPSSTSNTTGLALRYRNGGLWSARVGYEWTGTNHPGYLIVPGSNSRMYANVQVTPGSKVTFTNDLSVNAQNAFPSPALPNTASQAQGFGGDIAGLPTNFQRRNRYYTDAASASIHPLPAWDLGLGYSYQQTNLTTYMAFQNDSSTNYVVDDPSVLYKQLSQVVWGNTSYTVKDRLGVNLQFTHNASSSGYRPDLNPNDAASQGNAALIQQGVFDPGMYQSALNNLALSSTQISEVRVPQWIGQGKASYRFPYKIEGGIVFQYGSYGDYWNQNLNGAMRVFDIYLGRNW